MPLPSPTPPSTTTLPQHLEAPSSGDPYSLFDSLSHLCSFSNPKAECTPAALQHITTKKALSHVMSHVPSAKDTQGFESCGQYCRAFPTWCAGVRQWGPCHRTPSAVTLLAGLEAPSMMSMSLVGHMIAFITFRGCFALNERHTAQTPVCGLRRVLACAATCKGVCRTSNTFKQPA